MKIMTILIGDLTAPISAKSKVKHQRMMISKLIESVKRATISLCQVPVKAAKLAREVKLIEVSCRIRMVSSLSNLPSIKKIARIMPMMKIW